MKSEFVKAKVHVSRHEMHTSRHEMHTLRHVDKRSTAFILVCSLMARKPSLIQLVSSPESEEDETNESTSTVD